VSLPGSPEEIDELEGGLTKGSDTERPWQGGKMQKDAAASLVVHGYRPLFLSDYH
jgi:hypothetical protein